MMATTTIDPILSDGIYFIAVVSWEILRKDEVTR